jgi:hypothetical protein
MSSLVAERWADFRSKSGPECGVLQDLLRYCRLAGLASENLAN